MWHVIAIIEGVAVISSEACTPVQELWLEATRVCTHSLAAQYRRLEALEASGPYIIAVVQGMLLLPDHTLSLRNSLIDSSTMQSIHH